MFNKLFATALTVLLLVASVGHAANMQVTSSAVPVSGGTITPNGIKISATDVTYLVAPKAGWSLASVLIDGVPAAGPQVVLAGSQYKVLFDTSKVHTIKANFSQALYSITTTSSAGGSVSVTGGGTVNITPGSNRSVVVAPSTGYKIATLTVDGAPVIPANPNIAYTKSFSNIQASHTVAATFSESVSATVYTGGNKTVAATVLGSFSTSLNGTVTSNPAASAYLWAVTSGPAGAVFINGTTLTPTFTGTTLGTYTITLRATVAGENFTSAPATISVVAAGVANPGSSSCMTCHAGSASVIAYPATLHAINDVTCSSCHNPSGSAPHPYNSLAVVSNVCSTCHSDSQGNVPNHPLEIGGNACGSCHNPHSLVATVANFSGAPHYNSITSGTYPASYVTSRAACTNCHVANSANFAIRQQWKKSGHANTTSPAWITFDFKTQSGCVQCHTTTGFIAFSTAKVTAAWGVAADKTKEVLRCVGCHSDISSGTVRTVTPAKPYVDDTGYTNRNVGISNACMDCHSGRNNGVSITGKVGVANFTNLAFIPPHYKAAGGVLQAKGGYNFPGQTYAFYSSNSHRIIGMGGSTGNGGPCVGCHMSATQRHLFKAVSTATNGTIVKIASNVCASCHGSTLDDTTAINARQASFNNALQVLQKALLLRGFVYSSTYPYFSNTNWGTAQAGANIMGGAFNYVLLLSEPAAYVHNADYTKKLLFDSIDSVYNGGTVTGSIENTLAGLVGAGAISQAQADSVLAYKTASSCLSCHPSLSGSHSAHVGDLLASVATYGDSGNYSTTGLYRFGCGTCHPNDPAMHRNGTVDVTMMPDVNAGTLRNKNTAITDEGLNVPGSGITGTTGAGVICANIYCHSNGYGENKVYATTPNWYGGSFTGDKCANCHGNSPNTVIAGSPAHAIHVVGIHSLNVYNGISGNLPVGSSGNVGHGIASQSTTLNCNICHVDTVTSGRNDNNTACISCHQSQGNAAQIADRRNHVNGFVDVSFQNISVVSKAQLSSATFDIYSGNYWTRNGGNYKNGATAFDVTKKILKTGASYDGGGGCSNVSCHLGQAVKWTDKPVSYCAICHTDL